MERGDENKSMMPRHVAIIMDGNGRWAKLRGLPRTEGHVKGVEIVRKITEKAAENGIEYLTLYAFSTENWNRPKTEVDMLMELIVIAIERETPDLIRNNIKLTTIGDTERLPGKSRDKLKQSIQATSHCTGLTLCLALSYSSRWEITHTCRLIASKVKDGLLKIEDIDDSLFAENLNTSSMPDPDLLIRTGGDRRISNFMLWQLAYTELYFTPVFWPDFTSENFMEAINEYQSRERRYGLTSEQIRQ